MFCQLLQLTMIAVDDTQAVTFKVGHSACQIPHLCRAWQRTSRCLDGLRYTSQTLQDDTQGAGKPGGVLVLSDSSLVTAPVNDVAALHTLQVAA